MNDKPSEFQQAADLRRRAEAQVRGHASTHPDSLPPEQARQFTEELQLYPIELELQNEELRRTEAAVEAGSAPETDITLTCEVPAQ